MFMSGIVEFQGLLIGRTIDNSHLYPYSYKHSSAFQGVCDALVYDLVNEQLEVEETLHFSDPLATTAEWVNIYIG